MLPWFQSILDLTPTEQWRCSLPSKYNYRSKGIQFLRFCHFYPKCKLQVGGWEQAVHKVSAGFGRVCHAYKHKLQVVLLQSRLMDKVLAVSAISAERDSAFRSAEAGLCCFKAVLQIEKQR